MITASINEPKLGRLAQIAHVHKRGLHATIVRRETLHEFHVTIEPMPGDSIESLVTRLHSFISANNATIVRQEVFGRNNETAALIQIENSQFGQVSWPITCVEALSCERAPLAGIHTFAVAGAEVEPVLENGSTVGAVFFDGWARHCILGGIVPERPSTGRGKQTAQVFHQMARILRAEKMTFTNIARTWLFLDDILAWYDVFNKERQTVFEAHDVFRHNVPASTGIGAANLDHTALIAGAWAVQPTNGSVVVRPVESPLQCSARDYGSCFSRAIEIATPDLRRLFISGTASIAPDGHTEHVDDIRKQVALTMEVVEAILLARGMRWQNTTRATVYLKRAEDAWAFAEYAIEHDLKLPVVITQAAVCRDDLLFEIEIDALAAGQNRSLSDWQI